MTKKKITYTEEQFLAAIRNYTPYNPNRRDSRVRAARSAALEAFLNQDVKCRHAEILRQALVDLEEEGFFQFKGN